MAAVLPAPRPMLLPPARLDPHSAHPGRQPLPALGASAVPAAWGAGAVPAAWGMPMAKAPDFMPQSAMFWPMHDGQMGAFPGLPPLLANQNAMRAAMHLIALQPQKHDQ